MCVCVRVCVRVCVCARVCRVCVASYTYLMVTAGCKFYVGSRQVTIEQAAKAVARALKAWQHMTMAS